MRIKFRLLAITAALAIVLSVTFVSAEAVSISVFAGNGDSVFKDGKALEAGFNQPSGLVLDKDGGLIVVDSLDNKIRKIKDGQVTTIAGCTDSKDAFGMPAGGYSDGEITKARFYKPKAAVVDSKGNIFISDSGNNVIRKIIGGKVYTFAGMGKSGYANGKGNAAAFNCPLGLAVDSSDNIYVADSLNNVIRKITPKGEVSTFAGVSSEDGGCLDGSTSEALFNEPSDIVFDKAGALYVADSGNQLIRKIDAGKVTIVAGFKGDKVEGTSYLQGGFANGKAAEARFNFPKGLFVADDGTVFVADTWNHRVRAIRPNGTVVTVAGSGNTGRKDGELSVCELNGPSDVLYSAGTLYIADMWNNTIRAIKADSASLSGIIDRNELTQGINFGTTAGDVKIYMDKKPISFKDVKPYVFKGKVYLPVRFICEAWGAKVNWDGVKKEIVITKGQYNKVLDATKGPVTYKSGRAMLDTVSFSNTLGFRLEWYPEYNAVIVVPE